MQQKEAPEGIIPTASKQILLVFSTPKTPKQAAHELSVRKIRLGDFLKKHLLRCLNPEARKGRFYTLTKKARECLKCHDYNTSKDWDCIGWVISSPRQRLVILRCTDERKLTSEEIRMRATQFNASLTRPGTKATLRELVGRHLVNTEILERLRFYWITQHGSKIKDEVAVIEPITSLIS
ncbi:hypothetical protein JXA85_04310 [Candidatus Woesearchaeota archaeon]|nr:hypothetical protein [Candidatus Woesearchaeota archaeon]